MTENEFATLFDSYMMKKRDDMRITYHRVLPSGEYIFNRFDKADYLKCGKETSIYDTSVIMGEVQIGEHVWIGPYTILEGSNGKLRIGDYVSINAGVMIYTHDSTRKYVSGGAEPVRKGDVEIGSYTVVGTLSTISCGVRIGSHCVVAAYSFVNTDIESNSIYAGVPAKRIGRVELLDDGTTSFIYNSVK